MDHKTLLAQQVLQISDRKSSLQLGLGLLAFALIVNFWLFCSVAQAKNRSAAKSTANGTNNTRTAAGNSQSDNKKKLNSGPQAQPKPTIQLIPTIQQREPIKPRP